MRSRDLPVSIDAPAPQTRAIDRLCLLAEQARPIASHVILASVKGHSTFISFFQKRVMKLSSLSLQEAQN